MYVVSLYCHDKIKYIQLQQVCDDLSGDQLLLAHALSFPQHSLGDGTILKAPQLGAGAPQLTKLGRLAREHHSNYKSIFAQELNTKKLGNMFVDKNRNINMPDFALILQISSTFQRA